MSVKKVITVIRGDGIGPSLVNASCQVLDHVGAGLSYEFFDAGLSTHERGEALIPDQVIHSIEKNGVLLKGPLTTPIGEGFTSINVALRKKFNLFANVRPSLSYPNVTSHFSGIDIITLRENTEGLYCGEGQIIRQTADGEVAEAKSIITEKGSEQFLSFAYDLARKLKRKRVTIVHKANILKTTSGLFLKTARRISQKYNDIETKEMIVDNACMQLVMNPHQFDMIVTSNLFGDILSDLVAGLVGGLGMAPAANIGKNMAMFEAVHGSAPDIAGKNIANPTSLLLASALMLDYLEMKDKAEKIRLAIGHVLKNKIAMTRDLGGEASTTEFTQAVIDQIK